MKNMDDLKLNGNYVSDISALKDMMRIRTFEINANSVENFSYIKNKEELDKRRERHFNSQMIEITPENKIFSLPLYDKDGNLKSLLDPPKEPGESMYIKELGNGKYEILRKPKDKDYLKFVIDPHWNGGVKVNLNRLTFFEPNLKRIKVRQFTDPKDIKYNTAVLNLPNGANFKPHWNIDTKTLGVKKVTGMLTLENGENMEPEIEIEVVPAFNLSVQIKDKFDSLKQFENININLANIENEEIKINSKKEEDVNLKNTYNLVLDKKGKFKLYLNDKKQKAPDGYEFKEFEIEYIGDFNSEEYLKIYENGREIKNILIAKNGEIVTNDEKVEIVYSKKLNLPYTGGRYIKIYSHSILILLLSLIFLSKNSRKKEKNGNVKKTKEKNIVNIDKVNNSKSINKKAIKFNKDKMKK